jgi:hypothetical protein
MLLSPHRRRVVTGVLQIAVLAATLAPAAEARRRGHDRYKPGPYREVKVVRHAPHRGHGHGSVYVVRRSSAGPVIAGFLGGLFLGATLANAAPSGYEYYDPYCDADFASLEIYHAHLRRHHHPQVVRVIEVETGACAHTYRYDDHRWQEFDDRQAEDWDE